jgi:hypothetical protein
MNDARLTRDMQVARSIIESTDGPLPNLLILSDATAKHCYGPEAIGGVYIRRADGRVERVDDSEIDLL